MSVGPDRVVSVSLALYRRYRPETFAEVIGQEHVTDPLQQALRNNRVNHAYLFSGPRGCGKTTSARILARCLNCEQGPTPTPCGECQSCRDLARNGPGSIDVIEIDAASHGGVDDARDLREKAFFGPAGSRYKIYIIDEAHMVTSAGFNALLKVVEEPPEHLKFIFATTEPEKVIGTIRSRTHHYPFRLVPPGTLRDHLTAVCEREAIRVEDGVYPLVVRAGAGSVRDSMSVMDQLLSGAGADGVTYGMATALLGYTDAALLDDVVDGFAAGDGAVVFEMVDRVIEGGHDPRRFVADLLERLRDLVIIAAVPDAVEKGLIDAPREVVERMAVQASVFGAAELSRAADLVNTGLTEMRGATSPRLQLELICARVLLPAAYDDERSTQARLERLERGIASGAIGLTSAPNFGGEAGGIPTGPGGAAAARAALGRTGAEAGHAAPDAGRPDAGRQDTGRPDTGRVDAGRGEGQAAAPAPVQAPPPPSPQGGPAQPPAAPYDAPPVDGPPAAPRPGAWPVSQGGGTPSPGSSPSAPAPTPPPQQPPAAAPRPGAWPTTAGPGVPAAQQPPAERAPAPPAPPAAAPAGSQRTAQIVGDPARVRQMWPNILEAVKNRRRLTWMLLFNNAQVAGFDGETLQIGFDNPGARNSFTNNGSEDVLRAAINDALGVEWRIEAIVDPSGGGGGGGSSSGYGGPAGGTGGSGGPGGPGGFGGGGPGGPGGSGGQGGGPGGGGGSPRPPAAPQAQAQAQAPAQPPAGPSTYGGGAPAQAPYGQGSNGSGPAGAAPAGPTTERAAQPSHRPAARASGGSEAPPPPPDDHPDYAPIEDDIPEDDDPGLIDSAPSGHDLFIKELGATVIEEISHG
ncbi:DNA polymerase III subunit gamma and tau [Streptomyces polygonati]|uniref:DNA-directed DNA polymerase n=1 Tax=Streptomyces polygonati TaxID=1617087 RepID=A0ABV8HY15_9ACTN